MKDGKRKEKVGFGRRGLGRDGVQENMRYVERGVRDVKSGMQRDVMSGMYREKIQRVMSGMQGENTERYVRNVKKRIQRDVMSRI